MSDQPRWRLLANLGDVNPIDHGGIFVYVDETGHYPPEAERLESPDSDDSGGPWTVYRFPLDRCTFEGGILSDNAFHPEIEAWFADSIDAIASYIGSDPETLRAELCSPDPIELANGYRAVGEFYGFLNLDQYPITFTRRAEIEARYREE